MPSSAREVLQVRLAASAVLALTLVATSPGPLRAQSSCPPSPPRSPRPGASGGAVTSVDPYATRIGLEVLKQRRQRHRRGGRHRGRARGDRALQRRRGRRRVLRPLRRAPPARCRRSTVARPRRWGCPTTRSSTPRPGSPTASTTRSAAASRSACPAPSPPGSGRSTGGARATWRSRSARRPTSPATGFVVDQTFHDQTAANQDRFAAVHHHRGSCSCPAAARRAVGSTFRNPDLADTYRADRRPGPPGVLPRGTWPATSSPPCRTRRRPRTPRCPRRRATCERSDLSGYRVARPGADPLRLPGLRRLRHALLLQRRHDRRRGAQHPGALRPGHDVRPGRPAPLPRGRRPSRSPTAGSTSATSASSTSRSTTCSPTRTPPSGPARSTASRRRRSRSPPADVDQLRRATARPRTPRPRGTTTPRDCRRRT